VLPFSIACGIKGSMKMISTCMVATMAGLFGIARPVVAENAIYPALKDELVASKGKKLEKFDETPLANAKYYAIYYSAGWCGPCRAFTPDLVKWYKRHKSKNPHFDLIFVSADRSEEDMAKYMKDDDMPWPALAYDKKGSNRTLTKYAGSGIPCLVFLDETGKVLSDSYQGKTYIGPRKVLEDMEKTLRANPASADATAAAATKKAGSSNFDDFFKKKPAGQ
jgi:nucleoredoxin